MQTCDRCGGKTWSTIMSRFNTDEICMQCHDEEMLFPNYKKAEDAERRQCEQGNYNFKGIGLGPEDLAKMHELRQKRGGE